MAFSRDHMTCDVATSLIKTLIGESSCLPIKSDVKKICKSENDVTLLIVFEKCTCFHYVLYINAQWLLLFLKELIIFSFSVFISNMVNIHRYNPPTRMLFGSLSILKRCQGLQRPKPVGTAHPTRPRLSLTHLYLPTGRHGSWPVTGAGCSQTRTEQRKGRVITNHPRRTDIMMNSLKEINEAFLSCTLNWGRGRGSRREMPTLTCSQAN